MKEENKRTGLIIAVILIIIIVLICFFLFSGKKYTVTFDNVSGYDSVEVKKGNTLDKPKDPTKDGYKFVGWYLDGELFDFSTKITGDIKLEARFEAIEDGNEVPEEGRVIVRFDSDGGTSVGSQKIDVDEKASEPESPTKEGYTFVRWELNGKKYDFKSKVSEDITLKAVWKKNDVSTSTTKYTISFNSNGGSTVKSQSVIEGNYAVKPQSPTKKGYTFVRWELDGKEFSFDTPITKKITLKAIWKKDEVVDDPIGDDVMPEQPETVVKEYTVTVDNNGEVTTQKVKEGSTVVLPKAATKAGYAFVEWQLEDGTKFNESTKITKDITIKAVYKEIYTYTVTNFSGSVNTMQVKVQVYLGNRDVTSEVTALTNADHTQMVGYIYNQDFKAIVVKANETSLISQVYHNGWATIVER